MWMCVVYGWIWVLSCTNEVSSSSVMDTGSPETYTVSPCGLKDVAFTLNCVAPPGDDDVCDAACVDAMQKQKKSQFLVVKRAFHM